MKNTAYLATIAMLSASTAFAGGLDRSTLNISPMFEDGDYVELSFASVSPSVSGTVAGGALSSGDLATDYITFGAAMKTSLSDKFDMGVIINQPYGAGVEYPTGTGYPLAGTTASLTSLGVNVIGKYNVSDKFSAYAGLRQEKISANAAIPALSYSISAEDSSGLGYLVGAAYERKEIAMRVALTYSSAISHDVRVTEPTSATTTLTSDLSVNTPQSLTLDFQSGIAKDTLLFGSVRWAEWTAFDLAPPVYAGATGGDSLVAYDNDVITYNIGVGRRINENWSVAASYTYEKANGGISSNLSPTDGRQSYGLGVTYTQDNVKITAGVSRTNLGDADTVVPVAGAGTFTGNSATAFGIKIGTTF